MQPVNFYVVVPTRTGGGETSWPGFILFLMQGSLIFCNAINDTYIRIADLPFSAFNDPYTRNAAFCNGIALISLQSYNAN